MRHKAELWHSVYRAVHNIFPTAAGRIGAPFTLSTASISSIEEVATAAPNTLLLFQLYVYKDRCVLFTTQQFLRR